MGSNSSAQWKPPNDLYIVMDYRYCKVWVRKSDKIEHLQEYKLNIHNQSQLEQYQNMFAFRIQQPYFPASLHFTNQSTNSLCGHFKQGSILIQRIPYRLCQFANIPYNEAIAALLVCFKGYQILYHRYGLFRVKTTMIGLDRNYRIKLWHHTDLSSPVPEDPYCYSLIQMIQTIIRSIESVSAYPYNTHRFSQYLNIKKISLFSFDMAIKNLQHYSLESNLRMPDSFDHIQKYLKQAQGLISSVNRSSSNRSITRSELNSESKNKSLGKYSFRSNKIIQVNQDSNFQNHIYYNNNNNNHKSNSNASNQKILLLRSALSDEKIKLSKPSSIVKQPRLKIQQTHFRVQPPKQSMTSIDEYGLYRNRNSRAQNLNLIHSRVDSNTANTVKQQTRSREQQIHVPLSHGRAASDLPKMNKVYASKPSSPYYYENTETREGEEYSSSNSLKTMQYAQSFSFIADQDIKKDLIQMFKQHKNYK